MANEKKKIDLDELEKDGRADRFTDALEGAEIDAEKEQPREGFTPRFPASGDKGWGIS